MRNLRQSQQLEEDEVEKDRLIKETLQQGYYVATSSKKNQESITRPSRPSRHAFQVEEPDDHSSDTVTSSSTDEAELVIQERRSKRELNTRPAWAGASGRTIKDQATEQLSERS